MLDEWSWQDRVSALFYIILVGPFVLCFSPLVGSLVASVLVRLVWAGASEYVFSLDFGTKEYSI